MKNIMTVWTGLGPTLVGLIALDPWSHAAQGGRGSPRGAGGSSHGAPPSSTEGTRLSTASSDGSTSVSDLLKSFVEQLRRTRSSTPGYASGARQSSTSPFGATLVDRT